MNQCEIVLFGGTTEGRKLAHYLGEKEIPTHVCTATEYGESLVLSYKTVSVSGERWSKQEMKSQLKHRSPRYVIDATHPYATEVTENIQQVCEELGLFYLRVKREEAHKEAASLLYFETLEEAVAFLKKTSGNILATTGSKELFQYREISGYEKRVFARVLSVKDVVAHCEEMGFRGRNLICMQGPFSKEMNLAMIKEFQISYLVTKDSGKIGGFPQKVESALEAGISLIVIGRKQEKEGRTYEEMLDFLEEQYPQNRSRIIYLIGAGPGTREYMSMEAERICQEADLLIGSKRLLESFGVEGREQYEEYRLAPILSYLKTHPRYRKIAILLSGDLGFYSGAKTLRNGFQEEGMQVVEIPGISSVIYFCAKVGLSWEDLPLESLHGREGNLLHALRTKGRGLFLVDTKERIKDIGSSLEAFGLGEIKACVGEQLSYEEEKIIWCQGRDLVHYEGSSLAVVYLELPDFQPSGVESGLPDSMFLRGKVPMTKEEVRRISLSKLNLEEHHVLYDIGGGTGSVSIEAARILKNGRVYSVESNPEGVELIQQNQKKHLVSNLQVIEGMAPEALEGLPKPDRVFIGGNRGRLQEILSVLLAKNPQVSIVLNIISLNTLGEILSLEKEMEFSIQEVLQLAVSRGKKVGTHLMMLSENPIYILVLQGRKQKNEEDS